MCHVWFSWLFVRCLACFSHQHEEVGPFVLPVSRGGVSTVPPPGGQLARGPQGVLEEAPLCSHTLALHRWLLGGPGDSPAGAQYHARCPEAGSYHPRAGDSKGTSGSFQELQAPRERDEWGSGSRLSPPGDRPGQAG